MKGNSTENGEDTGRDDLSGTSSDGSRSRGRRSVTAAGGGLGGDNGGSGTGRTSGGGVASSGGDERTLTVEGRVAEALRVGGSTERHVGVRGDTALVVLVSAHLSAVLGLSRSGRSGGRSVAGESGLLRAEGGHSSDSLGGARNTGGLGTVASLASSGLDELAALPRVVVEAASVLSSAGGHVGIRGDTAVVVLVVADVNALTSVGGLGGRSIAGGGSNGLGDGARAVLNGEGGGLGDSVGLVAVGQGGGTGAVGGQVSDDLGGVVDGLVGRRSVVRSGRGGSEENAGDGGSLNETHCDGWFVY
ncbi:hypothetical protein HG530_006937 [Fusarium avenaceum]|nr:hypothetical protein HG530_006937 [Fusarium avenaceum]